MCLTLDSVTRYNSPWKNLEETFKIKFGAMIFFCKRKTKITVMYPNAKMKRLINKRKIMFVKSICYFFVRKYPYLIID